MLPHRSVSTILSHPATQNLINGGAKSASKVMRNTSPQSLFTQSTPLKSFTRNIRTSTPHSNSSSSSSSSSANSSSSSSSSSTVKKAAAILALPAFAMVSTSADDDKENEAPISLKCSVSSPRPLKESSSFLMPLDSAINDTRLCIGVSMIPHPAKVAKGGEDAYFISDDMKSIGVADGVGGWGDIGVDPALYARMLMASGKYSADCTYSYYRDPVKIMSDAYEHSTEVQGSSTCCIVSLDGYCLKTANLGDSGFMVLRGSSIVFRSKEQQHSFNFPYQLGTGSADSPAHAVSITVNIQPGDLIIVGTDGLWDNLYDDEIVEIASQASEPMTIAQLIARHAHATASSKQVISPFAKAARENGYPLATGGKMDDISVVVARVVMSSDSNMPSLAA